MMVDVSMLREKIDAKGISIQEFSKEMGINPSTFYRKLETDGLHFTIGQMHKAVELLALSKSDAVQIFLAG